MLDLTVRDAEQAAIRALIAERVDVRFSLDTGSFQSYLIDLARRISDAIAPSAVLRSLNLDDLYLARACAKGDDDAWSEFIVKYRAFIHRFAGRMLREPAAIDLADQVIADLWERRKIERYEGRSSLRTWIGTVTAHAAINTAKTNQARDPISDRTEPAVGADAEFDDAERSREVARLLAESLSRQPAQDQLLVLLHYEQGLTLDQMAPIIGLSKAALSRRLKKIRDTLLQSTDALARRHLGTPVRALADGLEWSRVDLDLRAACALAAQQARSDGV
jgi:RNA polymerase sigma-70 factor (ECF subfamily)